MERVIYSSHDYENDDEGRRIVVCKVCNAHFKSLKPLSDHLLSCHQLRLSLDTGRDDSDEDDDSNDNDADESESDEEEEGKEIWFTKKDLANCCRVKAQAGLKYLNEQVGGKRYELVEHGPVTAKSPAIQHVNFKAKEKDCPDAPVETFFAQMMNRMEVLKVDCCISLGPSHELPHWRKANLGGCKLCNGIIHHPTVKVDNLKLSWT